MMQEQYFRLCMPCAAAAASLGEKSEKSFPCQGTPTFNLLSILKPAS
jgi:hypothetical protein